MPAPTPTPTPTPTPIPSPLELDFDSFFNDQPAPAAAADTDREDIVLDELSLPADPVVEPSAESVAEPLAEPSREPITESLTESVPETVAESLAENMAESVAESVAEPSPPLHSRANDAVAPAPPEADFDIYAAEANEHEPDRGPFSDAAPTDAGLNTTESDNRDAVKTPAPTATMPAEPLSALDDLALELPDDWASLKKAPRQEPVFDDDNGLDLDERSVADTKPAAKPRIDKPTGPAPIASEQAELKPRRAAEPVPQPPQEQPAAATIAEPKKFGVFKSSSTEAFELHPDLAEFNNDDPLIGDWSLNQNETVDRVDDGDTLKQLAPTTTTKKTPASAPPSAAAPKVAATAVTNTATNAASADFGDISSDWDKPSVQLQPNTAAVAAREPEPVPFDSEAFTADPGSRVFQPLIDPVDELASDDWTIAHTEPREDYEASLFAPPPQRRFPWKGLAWTAAALLTLALLVSQLLWPQRGALREDPQWGPWVENICQHIECNLPPRVDVAKIQLQQKSVLKDRDDPRKLQIDLLIANTAEFSQPYPDIKLRFTNIEAEVVAERRFKPAEYLREQPDSDQMPVGVPIHIAFMVRAPDAKVTGYEFDFLPADK